MAIILFFLIEFLDELTFGGGDAALPFIRNDLHLSYVQIGLVLSFPGIVSNLIEPFLGIFGDIWRRRILILGGGIGFSIACALTAMSKNFIFLLLAFILMNPSSGAFVSLSQASLMDKDPLRHEQNMARWTFAGSLGVVLGPLLLGGLAVTGLGWRSFYIIISALTIILVFVAMRSRSIIPQDTNSRFNGKSLYIGFENAIGALKNKSVIRWLVLLEFSDLMLDVLYGYLALYFVDVVGFSMTRAALAVAVWTGCGLLGDLLIIPILEKLRGLSYLKFSVMVEFVLFPLFLVISQTWGKLILLGFLGLFNSGWYAILKGNLYTAVPYRSGTVMSLSSIAGIIGKIIPFLVGVIAEKFGLGSAMWILWLGPIVLLAGLPRKENNLKVTPG